MDKSGIILLSSSKLAQITQDYTPTHELPLLTLSLTKKLINVALTGCIDLIKNEISNIDYYLKTSWRAYKSHKNKKILSLEANLTQNMCDS